MYPRYQVIERDPGPAPGFLSGAARERYLEEPEDVSKEEWG